MRIGTWNLDGCWDSRRERLMEQQRCDVWLLTEVKEDLEVDGYKPHLTEGWMVKAQRKRWAGILSREPLFKLADPHPAGVLARVGEFHFCSSILPWRSSGGEPPWDGKTNAERTLAALNSLLGHLPQAGLIWGGDWNHAFSGPEVAGSLAGRKHIRDAVTKLQLKVPTEELPHHLPGLLTIDHIAVGEAVDVVSAKRIEASEDGRRLSDHDMYVVEIR